MIIKITRDGTEINISEFVERRSFSITEKIGSKSDICRIRVKRTDYIPQKKDEISIEYEGNIIFGGEIASWTYYTKGSIIVAEIKYNGYSYNIDDKQAIGVYENKSVTEVLTALVEDFVPTLSIGEIPNISTNIDYIRFDYVRVSTAFNQITKEYGLEYKVNPDKTIDFFNVGDKDSPYTVIDGNEIEIKDSLRYTNISQQIKNVIYVIGNNQAINERTDKIENGDGVKTTFNIPYTYDKLPEIRLNNRAQNVGVEGLQVLDTSKQVFWSRSGKYIRFVTAPGNQPITITGQPVAPIIVKFDASSRDDPPREKVVRDSSLLTRNAVVQRAKAEIEALSQQLQEIEFSTRETGLRVGDRIEIANNTLSLSDGFIVRQFTARFVGDRLVFSIQAGDETQINILNVLRDLIESNEKNFDLGLSREGSEISSIRVFTGRRRDNISIKEVMKIPLSKMMNEIILLDERARKNTDKRWVWGPVDAVYGRRKWPTQWGKNAKWQ